MLFLRDLCVHFIVAFQIEVFYGAPQFIISLYLYCERLRVFVSVSSHHADFSRTVDSAGLKVQRMSRSLTRDSTRLS